MGRSRDKGDKERVFDFSSDSSHPSTFTATRRARIEELRTVAAREFQHCDDIDAQIQRIEIEIQRLAGERDAHDARARRAVGDAARLEAAGV